MRRIPLNAPTFGAEEIDAAIEVLRSTHVTMGKRCAQFEDAFASYLGVGEAIFVNSGSSANLLTFFALANHAAPKLRHKRSFNPGFEVIVPAVSWSTTFWPIVQAGGVPVFVDSDPQTLQLKPAALQAAISDKTAAVCLVHVLGNSVDMRKIVAVAEENGLWIIEDTCEALGARFEGNFAGTFGDVATFSFYFSHHITTIEGGMVVTRHPDLAELLRCMRAHGWTRNLKARKQTEALYPEIDSEFLFINTGFNLRPTEINAAFGLIQLKKLEAFNRKRQEMASSCHRQFASLIDAGIFAPMKPTPGADVVWFGYPVICRDQQVRRELKDHLRRHEIETRPIICGNMTRQPAFAQIPHRISGELTGADRIMDCGLLWGMSPLMLNEELEYVIDCVARFAVNT